MTVTIRHHDAVAASSTRERATALSVWTCTTALDWCNAPVSADEFNGGSSDAERWWGAGCSAGDEVRQLIRSGWRAGLVKQAECIELLRDAMPTVPRATRSYRWRDDGDPDADRIVLQGELDRGFRQHRKRTSLSPTGEVTVLVNGGALADVTADEYRWRGAVAMVACDTLERAGYRVSVVLAARATGCGGSSARTMLTVVPLHQSGNPVQPDLIAAACGIAGAHRSCTFGTRAAMDSDMHGGRDPVSCYGMGSTASISPELVQQHAPGIVRGLPLHVRRCFDEQQAKAVLADIVARGIASYDARTGKVPASRS